MNSHDLEDLFLWGVYDFLFGEWFGLLVWGLVLWIPGIPENERDCYLGVSLESQTTNPHQQLTITVVDLLVVFVGVLFEDFTKLPKTNSSLPLTRKRLEDFRLFFLGRPI